MDLGRELGRTVVVLRLAQAEGVDVGGAVEVAEERAVALDGAPPRAGWSWLAGRGDEGAALAAEYERAGWVGGCGS